MSFLGISALCGLLAAGLVFPLAATGGAAASAGSDVLEEVPTELAEEPLSTPSRIYANDGETLLATFYEENRQPVSYDQISQHMKDALIAIEDERFFEHGGVDAQGVARAMVHNLTRPTQQGASTLTMQYVNNVLNNASVVRGEGTILGSFAQEKTYADKLREMKLAVSVEQEMTKEEILEGYLNIVMLGGTNYGVEAAAQYYWGIPASELNIQQSATLAGLVQSPNYYRPDQNPEAALERRNVVLGTMLRNGFITEEEYDEAVASELDLDVTPTRSGCVEATMGHYFCDYVAKLIRNDETFGETEEDRERLLYRGGLNVVTTLDPDAQTEAEDTVYETVPVDDPSNNRASLISLDPETGNILAMAQSTVYDPEPEDGNTTVNYNLNFEYGQSGGFNVGSTLKPFIAAAYVEEGGSMDDVVDASVDEYEYHEEWTASCMPGGTVPLLPDGEGDESEAWTLENVGDNMNRRMTIDYGLYYSINTATAATAHDMDLCAIDDILDRLEIKRAKEFNGTFDVNLASTPAAMLGAAEISPLTLARAYGAFANDGVICQPRALLEVTDQQGTEYDLPEEDCEERVDPDVIAQVNDTLVNIAERPLGDSPFTPGNPPFPMLGKTGTAAGSSNTWFAGSTEGMTSVAHIGRTDGNARQLTPTINGVTYEDGFYGSSLAQPMWYDYMVEVAEAYPTGDFRESSNSPFSDRRDYRYSSPIPGSSSDNGDSDDDDSDDD